MRRGNRVVTGVTGPRPAQRWGPACVALLPFSPLRSHQGTPGTLPCDAHFWKAGTGPAVLGRGSAVGPGVAQQERELSCLPVPVVTMAFSGPLSVLGCGDARKKAVDAGP